MLLLPSEKPGMVAALEEKKVPIKEIKINPQKHQDITQSMIALLAKWAELKEFAKSGLVSYIKSVHLSPSKAIFDLNKMDLAQLSRSYGLAQCPRLRWLNKTAKGSKSGSGSGREAAGGAEEDKLAGLGVEGDSDGGEDGGEFELKSEQPEMPEPLSYSDPSTLQRMERERRKKVKIKDSGQTNVKAGKRTVFDDDGAEQRPFFSQLLVRLLRTVSAQMAPPPRAHSSPQKWSHQLPEMQYMSQDIWSYTTQLSFV